MYFLLLVFFKVMAYQLDGLGESSIYYFRGGGRCLMPMVWLLGDIVWIVE